MCRVVFFGIAMIFLAGFPVNKALPSPPEIPQWPAECEGKTYCTKKPPNYPEEMFAEMFNIAKPKITNRNGGVEERVGGEKDVGSCIPIRSADPVYLIKDDNDRVRLVAQTAAFKTIFTIEECSHPGRITNAEVLDTKVLANNRVDCYETKVAVNYFVLSLDGSSLESVGPKGGIPVSCSAKVIKPS